MGDRGSLPKAFATVIGGSADQSGSSSGISALVCELIMVWSFDCASFGVRAAVASSGSAKVMSMDSGAMVNGR